MHGGLFHYGVTLCRHNRETICESGWTFVTQGTIDWMLWVCVMWPYLFHSFTLRHKCQKQLSDTYGTAFRFFGQVYYLVEGSKLFFWVLMGLKDMKCEVQIKSGGLRSILGFCKRTTIPSSKQLWEKVKKNVVIYC